MTTDGYSDYLESTMRKETRHVCTSNCMIFNLRHPARMLSQRDQMLSHLINFKLTKNQFRFVQNNDEGPYFNYISVQGYLVGQKNLPKRLT